MECKKQPNLQKYAINIMYVNKTIICVNNKQVRDVIQ
jgi:hypothetical protein